MASSKAKGKQRAIHNETSYFEDLDPVITYKHVLSTSMGVHDPLRVISLVDSDAFYAACEMVRLDVPPDVPLVVRQWEAVIAVNYPARTFGISRMDKAKEAVKKCPQLKVIHVPTYKPGMKEPGYWNDIDNMSHKVSLDVYRRESVKIHAKFKEILPDAEIERASIDEAFFDLTKPIRTILLQRYPYLAQPPTDSPLGIDTPLPPPPPVNWDGLGNLIPVHPSEGDDESKDEPPTTWLDVAFSIAAELMTRVRDEVRIQLGYTTSAGIARNKCLAKLCASYKKPCSQNILRNCAIPGYLLPLPFQKIRNLGGKLGKAVAQHYDATLVGDLLVISLVEMQQTFGPEAIWVWEILRGCDWSEVKEKASVNKSMLASKNLPKPVTKQKEGAHWIDVLAAELALRLNDARQVTPGLWPKALVLHARKGYEATRSKQAAFPFSRNVTGATISTIGNKLWDDLVGNKVLHVTNISLAFTGIEASEIGQQSIAEFWKNSTATTSPLKRPRLSSEGLGALNPTITDDNTIPLQQQLGEDADDDDDTSFHCTRCNKMIKLAAGLYAEYMDEEERTWILAQHRLEHSDFHFAQDLAKERTTGGNNEDTRECEKPSSSSSEVADKNMILKKSKSLKEEQRGTGIGNTKTKKKNSKKPVNSNGIEKFFQARSRE